MSGKQEHEIDCPAWHFCTVTLASRAVSQVGHTSQGSPLRSDKRAPTPLPATCTALTRCGLMNC